MKKTKILFLIESLSGGGAEKVLITLLSHLDYTRFEVTLCCVSNIGKYLEQIPQSVHYLALLPNYSTLTKMQKIGYRIKYNLIHKWIPLKWVYQYFIPCYFDVEVAFVEGFATKLLASSSNKDSFKLAWVHIDLHQFHWTRIVYQNNQEEEKTYQKFNQIICVSKTVEQAFKQEFKEVKVPVQTLYNPIDSQEIIDKSAVNFPFPERIENKVRLVSVGRFTKQKAYDRLLRVIKRLTDEKFGLELWLLGDGEQREKLSSYIEETHLSSVVTLWGFQENPYAYVKQCDLFVCSSVSEGYSTAVTEALILGIPVVTTDCSGMGELLGDDEYGIITENTEEALYQGLKKILADPDMLEQYRLKAGERGKDFSLEALVKPIENILLS